MSGHGNCAICGKHDYLRPLHDDNGGPLCCILCAGNWHGKHGRRRRLGRIVIRAMAAYLDGRGKLDRYRQTKNDRDGARPDQHRPR
jgi:hypothetical protein